MKTRSEWISGNDNLASYIGRQEMIDMAKQRFDIQRFESAEGEIFSVRSNIYDKSTWVEEYGVINSHKNPYNEDRDEKTIFTAKDTTAKKGSYIYWEDTYWLITSKVDGNRAYNYSKLLECNNLLKWYNSDGKLMSYPCIFSAQSKANSFDYNQSLDQTNSICKISVQYNEDTNQIIDGDRFIFNGLAYKVSSVNKHIQNTLELNDVAIIVFDMVRDEVQSANDDLVNNIADIKKYNYELSLNQEDFECSIGDAGKLTYALSLNDSIITDKNVLFKSENEDICIIDNDGNYTCLTEGSTNIICYMEDNENIYDSLTITVNEVLTNTYDIKMIPNDTKILQGDTQIYEVYKSVNEVKTSDVLTIEDVSNIYDAKYYYTFSTENNTFTIKNIKMCEDVVRVKIYDDDIEKIFKITLGGSW